LCNYMVLYMLFVEKVINSVHCAGYQNTCIMAEGNSVSVAMWLLYVRVLFNKPYS